MDFNQDVLDLFSLKGTQEIYWRKTYLIFNKFKRTPRNIG